MIDLIDTKVSIMLSDESSFTGVVDCIVTIADQEFVKFKSGRIINAGFILEIYIHDEAQVIPLRPTCITT